MPSLSHDLTAIEAPIISGRSRARLAVRSKPVRLNIRSGSNDIGGIVSKSRAMRAVEKVEVLSDALEDIGRIW